MNGFFLLKIDETNVIMVKIVNCIWSDRQQLSVNKIQMNRDNC